MLLFYCQRVIETHNVPTDDPLETAWPLPAAVRYTPAAIAFHWTMFVPMARLAWRTSRAPPALPTGLAALSRRFLAR
jgi:hypothetical protein